MNSAGHGLGWRVGPQVSGTLYVDGLLTNMPPYGQFSANELAGRPYSYTIK
jgi:hypothetical protein